MYKYLYIKTREEQEKKDIIDTLNKYRGLLINIEEKTKDILKNKEIYNEISKKPALVILMDPLLSLFQFANDYQFVDNYSYNSIHQKNDLNAFDNIAGNIIYKEIQTVEYQELKNFCNEITKILEYRARYLNRNTVELLISYRDITREFLEFVSDNKDILCRYPQFYNEDVIKSDELWNQHIQLLNNSSNAKPVLQRIFTEYDKLQNECRESCKKFFVYVVEEFEKEHNTPLKKLFKSISQHTNLHDMIIALNNNSLDKNNKLSYVNKFIDKVIDGINENLESYLSSYHAEPTLDAFYLLVGNFVDKVKYEDNENIRLEYKDNNILSITKAAMDGISKFKSFCFANKDKLRNTNISAIYKQRVSQDITSSSQSQLETVIVSNEDNLDNEQANIVDDNTKDIYSILDNHPYLGLSNNEEGSLTETESIQDDEKDPYVKQLMDELAPTIWKNQNYLNAEAMSESQLSKKYGELSEDTLMRFDNLKLKGIVDENNRKFINREQNARNLNIEKSSEIIKTNNNKNKEKIIILG